MVKKGKCSNCKVIYTWKTEIPLCNTICYQCGQTLEATSSLSKLPKLNILLNKIKGKGRWLK